MPEFDPLRAKIDIDADDALRSMNGMITSVGNFRVALGGAGAALVGFAAALSIREAIQFEAALANVAKTVDATDEEIAALGESLQAMAARIPVSSGALAELASVAGQLGVSVANLEKFVETAAALGVSTNLAATTAAESLARLSNILGTSEEDFDRLGSAVVDLGNNSATTEAEIVEMSLRIAGAGRVIGLTEGEVLGFAAALSSVGIRAEAGGTAISRVMREISSAVKGGGAELERFAAIAGTSAEDFRRSFEQDAAGAIVEFIQGIRGVIEAGGDVSAVLESVALNDIRVADTLLRAAQATDLFRGSLERGNTAFAANTALAEEAARFYGTTAAQLQIVKNRFSDLAEELGTNLLPVVIATIQKANTLLGILARIASTFTDDAAQPRGLDRFELAIEGLRRTAGVSLRQVEQLDEGVRVLADRLRSDVRSTFLDQVAELIRTTATAGNLENVAGGIRNLFDLFPKAGDAAQGLGTDLEALLERLRELANEGDAAAESMERLDSAIAPPTELFDEATARIRDQLLQIADQVGGPIGQAIRDALRDAEGWRDRIRQIATIAGGPLATALRDLASETRLNLDIANELPTAADAYAESLERARRKAEEHRREILDLVRGIEAGVRGAIDLGQAFGAIGPELAAILNSATNLGSAISGIATATSFTQALPFAGQAFGAGANLIAGVLGESESGRRIRQAQQENTVALDRVKASLDTLKDSLDQLTGETLAAFDEVLAIERPPTSLGSGAPEILAQAEAVGLTATEVENLGRALRIPVDELVKLLSGAQLSAADQRIAVAQLLALQEAILAASDAGNSFSAQMTRLRREFELFDIDDPIEQLGRMRALFLEFVELPDALEAAIAGADLSTPEGRAAFERALAKAFEALGLDPRFAGELTGPDAEAFLEELKRASDALEESAESAGDAESEGFRTVRTITEVGANLMIAVLTTIAITLDQIKAIEEAQLIELGGTIPENVGGRLPAGFGGVADPTWFGEVTTQLAGILEAAIQIAANTSPGGASGNVTVMVDARGAAPGVGREVEDAVIRALPVVDRGLGVRRVDAAFFSGRPRVIE